MYPDAPPSWHRPPWAGLLSTAPGPYFGGNRVLRLQAFLYYPTPGLSNVVPF